MIEVRYVDHLGNDLLVANAARRSFGAEYSAWSETPRTRRGRGDGELIQDLARDGHVLPFRHPQITLACTAPIPVARQLGKHQVGFSWSEISRRYKTGGITLHRIADWRAAPADARQGSGPVLPSDVGVALVRLQDEVHACCVEAYHAALAAGATPEQARFLLPQSMDVHWTWTGSLLGWSDLCAQRQRPDSQGETRDFACLVSKVIAPLFPVSWAALACRKTPSAHVVTP